MSSAFAIAAVTAVLKDLLNNRLVDHKLDAVGNVNVTALPPDRIPVTSADEQSQLNVFLYQVTPNTGWRNEGLPSRAGNGTRLTNPPLALDLHYLITAYGAKEFHAEVLLGYAMQLLHENPVLTRAMINTTLKPSLPPGVTLPSGISLLSTSDLAEQIELIKICPQYLSNDEMSKIWTALQAHYRPTAAYQMSVVLIQETKPTKTSLPVLARGQDDRGPAAVGSLIPPYPAIDRIELPKKQISAQPGDTITIGGHDLALGNADPTKVTVTVQFMAPRLAQPMMVTVPAQDRSDSHLNVAISKSFPAGFYRVSVSVMPNGKPKEAQATNEFPLMIAPRITQINGTDLPKPPDPLIGVLRSAVVDDLGDATLSITCSPAVLPEQPEQAGQPAQLGQTASLVIGDREVLEHTTQTDTVTFIVKQIAAGTYRLRLRVDGVDSLLVDRSDPLHPKFDDSQQVTIT